ncbi:MAG: sensor histidine kinase [Gemmatimonadota bacterium]
MRIRLQLLLPLTVGLLVGGGFVVAAATVGSTVHDALLTVPGITRDRAVESAVATVTLAGILVTALAVVLSALLGRMIVAPLRRMQRAAERLATRAGEEVDFSTSLAEIQDVARRIGRVGSELRARHRRELRERSELAALVEAVSEGILQIGEGGRIVRMNRASRVLLNLPDDALGRRVSSLFRRTGLRRLLERPPGGGTETTEVVLDDRRLLVAVSPHGDGGAVVTVVDLTDLRRLEEVRRDFVANASHELKTPLTSIRGYAETLATAELPEPERRQFLETIARNAGRLQHIVDDLLDLSRLETGRWSPELEPVDVAQAAAACWRSFADRAANQNVAFKTDGSGGRARADRRALEQVFANLFDNALRYTADGRVRVTTRSVTGAPEEGGERRGGSDARQGQEPGPELEAHGEWIVVEVEDTGTGIPRDALPRIFERFYRVDPARSRAEGGTGLGLSIVKHMVESMGGRVEARSELGKGTTIRFRLPAAPEHDTSP